MRDYLSDSLRYPPKLRPNLHCDQSTRCLGWRMRKRTFVWDPLEKEVERLRVLNKIGMFNAGSPVPKPVHVLDWHFDNPQPANPSICVRKPQKKDIFGFVPLECSVQSPGHVEPDPKVAKPSGASTPKGLSDVTNTSHLSSPDSSYGSPMGPRLSRRRLFWGILESYEDFVGSLGVDDPFPCDA